MLSLKRTTSYIDRLPDELLLDIFDTRCVDEFLERPIAESPSCHNHFLARHLIDTGEPISYSSTPQVKEGVRTAGCVSRRWRELIKHASLLWVCRVDLHSQATWKLDEVSKLLDENVYDLDITISISEHDAHYDEHGCLRVFDMLIRYAQRWRSISYYDEAGIPATLVKRLIDGLNDIGVLSRILQIE